MTNTRFELVYKKNGVEKVKHVAACEKVMSRFKTGFLADREDRFTLEIYEYGKLIEIIDRETGR